MPNYLLLLHEDPAAFANVSPNEMQEIIQKYSDWKQRMQNSGAMVRGQKLQNGTGRVLHRTGGETAAIDGPYTESKEVIGGLFEIRAEDYEHAVAASLECPHLEYGTIEVREIEPVPGD